MTLEEIRKIDTEPFDTDLTEEFCNPAKPFHFYYENIMAILIERYFKQFMETYGINLDVSVQQILIVKQGFEDEDYDVEWLYAGLCLCRSAMKAFGWSFLEVDISDEARYNRPKKEEDEKVWAKEQILEWIQHNEDVTEADTNMILREQDAWLDTVIYLDYGRCFFFWNDKLSLYLTWKEKNIKKVQLRCGEEDAEISELLNNIWYPIMYFENSSSSCVNGRYYGMLTMGSNGELEVDYDSFDPNWVTRAFVLDRLLDLALSKLFGREVD